MDRHTQVSLSNFRDHLVDHFSYASLTILSQMQAKSHLNFDIHKLLTHIMNQRHSLIILSKKFKPKSYTVVKLSTVEVAPIDFSSFTVFWLSWSNLWSKVMRLSAKWSLFHSPSNDTKFGKFKIFHLSMKHPNYTF